MAWGYWSATVVSDKGRSPRKQSSSRLNSNFVRRASFRDPLALSSTSRELSLASVCTPSSSGIVQNHAAECPVAIAAAEAAASIHHLHHPTAASAPVSPAPTPAPTRENSPVPSERHTSDDEVEIIMDEVNYKGESILAVSCHTNQQQHHHHARWHPAGSVSGIRHNLLCIAYVTISLTKIF
jgi:hypothetical protein